jgi:CMP-N-acetylneuraminic acid synthetase
MKELNDILFLVQARLGSQRLSEKMITSFSGTTLTDICLKKIKSSTFIPSRQFYVSVYEEELKQVCERNSVNIFHRSESSAKCEGTPMTLMYEWHDKLPFKYCVLINACAPFMQINTVERFTKAYINSDSDGMFGVITKKNYFWNKDSTLITPWPEGKEVMMTNYVEETYEAAHCLYAGKMNKIKDGIWMGDFQKPGDIELFPMEERECLDIDYQWQFNMCESLYKSELR